MSKEIWTVIKYKPKDGCEEEFVDGLKRLGRIIDKSKAGQKFQNTFIKIDSGEYVQIVQMPHFCLLYTSPSPRDRQKSRMPSSA